MSDNLVVINEQKRERNSVFFTIDLSKNRIYTILTIYRK